MSTDEQTEDEEEEEEKIAGSIEDEQELMLFTGT